jgi:hypothetical protein
MPPLGLMLLDLTKRRPSVGNRVKIFIFIAGTSEMNDDTRRMAIGDLEEARTHHRLKEVREKILDGTIECCAILLYLKDGTSRLVVVGGTSEARIAVRARLEEKEAELVALKAQCRLSVAKIFAHFPEEERHRVLDSPQRLRVALNTLSADQRVQLSPISRDRLLRYLTLLEGI